MKLKSILLPATLALASLASVASAANVSVNFSDIILGFRSTESGETLNLEVNIGSVSQFTQASLGSTIVVANLKVADLVAAYGTNWYTSTTSFGLIGTTGQGADSAIGPDGQSVRTVYVSNNGTPYTSHNGVNNGLAVAKALLLSVGTQTGALTNNAATANSATSALVDSAKTGSWSNAGFSTTNAFNGVGYTKTKFESSLTGTSVSTSLYELLPTNGSVSEADMVNPTGLAATVFQGKIGTFSLADTGVLTFTSSGLHASAVPEPSTYAALAGAAVLGFVAYRRRSAVRV